MDKKDNSLDDVINKRLLDGTIDRISDCLRDVLDLVDLSNYNGTTKVTKFGRLES